MLLVYKHPKDFYVEDRVFYMLLYRIDSETWRCACYNCDGRVQPTKGIISEMGHLPDMREL